MASRFCSSTYWSRGTPSTNWTASQGVPSSTSPAVEQGGDMRMFQGGEGAALAGEALGEGAEAQRCVEQLQRRLLVEIAIDPPGDEDLPHASPGQRGLHLPSADAGAGREGAVLVLRWGESRALPAAGRGSRCLGAGSLLGPAQHRGDLGGQGGVLGGDFVEVLTAGRAFQGIRRREDLLQPGPACVAHVRSRMCTRSRSMVSPASWNRGSLSRMSFSATVSRRKPSA